METTITGQVHRSPGSAVEPQELVSALLQGSRIIIEHADFRDSGKLLFQNCHRLIGSAAGCLALTGTDGIAQEIVAMGGIDDFEPDTVGNAIIASRLLRRIGRLRSPIVNNYPDKLIPELFNIVAVPLHHNQHVFGVMVMANRSTGFTGEDVSVLEAFAELAALAWFNSKNMEALKAARQKAEESERLKSAFLSNMSHEIRTPLNGILGFSQLLSEPGLDAAEREQFIGIMNQCGKQLMSLINNILDISLVESGQLILKFDSVELKSVVNELCGLFRSPGLEKPGVDYQFDIESFGEIVLQTDRVRLLQILVNLVGNATKFTINGHIRVFCRVVSVPSGREVVISVEDTGIGICAEKLEVIFERFRQAEVNTARNFGGFGLGLAISKALAGLLGGRMAVSSIPGKGSTFSLVLPLP